MPNASKPLAYRVWREAKAMVQAGGPSFTVFLSQGLAKLALGSLAGRALGRQGASYVRVPSLQLRRDLHSARRIQRKEIDFYEGFG